MEWTPYDDALRAGYDWTDCDDFLVASMDERLWLIHERPVQHVNCRSTFFSVPSPTELREQTGTRTPEEIAARNELHRWASENEG